MKFSELSLSPELMAAVNEMGFSEATGIQEKAIPAVRTGADVLARSQTGTGKTVAFGIPAVECVNPDFDGVQVLVLSPTRELARQCGEQIRKLSRYLPYVKTADIFGGANYTNQFRELRSANIIIGTPGRIMDHIRRGTINLTTLKMVVLDEADEMLNMGFREDIEFILQDVPEERQIVLFSATIPAKIREITKRFQKNPVHIEIDREKITLKNIKQLYTEVPSRQKNDALSLLLHRYRPNRAIIFANKKSSVDELVNYLVSAGFSADGLHGDMRQEKRTSVMNAFRNGRVNILVATDVAARGIDVSDVDFVFNFDIPQERDYYVHRIGRTGRAGRTGTAVTLCCGRNQVLQLRRLGREIKSDIEEAYLPTVAEIEKINCAEALEKIADAVKSEPNPAHTEMVKELKSRGFSAERIAAALLDVYFVQGTDKLADIAQPKRAGKEAVAENLDDMDVIVLDIGSGDRVAVNHIVGAITEHSNISSRNLGKIKIYESFTTVEVAAELVKDVVQGMRGRKINGKPVHIDYFREDDDNYSKPRKSEKKSRKNGKKEFNSDKKRHSSKKRSSYNERPYGKKGKASKPKNGKSKKRVR